MKVSILVPIYGVEEYIEKCSVSLFEQTYKNIEYIFVNDCTPDNSIGILKKIMDRYPQRKDNIKIINHDTNYGLAQARNTALENSSGDFILNVDSDDFLERNATEMLCNVAQNEKADVVVFGCYVVYKKIRMENPNTYVYTTKEKYIKSLLEKKISSCVWGKFISRDLYLKNNIRAIPGINQGEDYAVIPRLMYFAEHIVMIKDCLYNYTQYNMVSYTKTFHKEHIKQLLKADDILINFFSSISDSRRYEKTLMIAKLRTKTYMLKIANDIETIKNISKIYSEIPCSYYNYMSTADKLLLRLLNKKYYKLILLITRISLNIKRIMSLTK